MPDHHEAKQLRSMPALKGAWPVELRACRNPEPPDHWEAEHLRCRSCELDYLRGQNCEDASGGSGLTSRNPEMLDHQQAERAARRSGGSPPMYSSMLSCPSCVCLLPCLPPSVLHLLPRSVSPARLSIFLIILLLPPPPSTTATAPARPKEAREEEGERGEEEEERDEEEEEDEEEEDGVSVA